jgi:four helix bundle protein
MFKFEKLKVWEKALDLSLAIHTLTRGFPKEELYVLTSQMKRAADSIGLNIAEGSTGQSNAEFRQFLKYSMRSAMELVACLFLARKRGLIATKEFDKSYAELEEVIRMLHGLRRSIK